MQREFERLQTAWSPHPGQREFLACDAPIRVLACGRRWGKTDACAASIVLGLLSSKPQRTLLIAPTLDQAGILFDRIVSLLDEVLAREEGASPKIRRSPYPQLAFGPHRVVARSGHLGRNLRGNEATHIVIDEAAFVPEELVNEVALPMLATTKGQLTLISTPNGMNHFWRFFNLGQEGRHGVWSRRAPSAENPLVSGGFLQIQRELISERAFSVEYEASFMDSAGRVFRTEDIDAALVTELPEPGSFVAAGIDWARYSDHTALCVVSGDTDRAVLHEVRQIAHLPWREQLEVVQEVLARYPQARIVCDGTGAGDPVSDMLREAIPGHSIESVVFTRPTKSSLIGRLQMLFERRSVKMLPHPALMKELSHFEAVTSGTGTKLQAGYGFHDDIVVALALAVSKLPVPYRARSRVGAVRSFDPAGGSLC